MYGDAAEATKVKKYLNYRIAEKMEYYKNKIAFPYKETIGVGSAAEDLTIHTSEEIIQFLKSDTNGHELIAMANLFNIKINIFTYNGNEKQWSQVWRWHLLLS